MTTDELQAALDAATATLSSGGIPRASLHARDVIALAAEVSALRDVLSQTQRERDAYRKAKRENDERFMIERDVARRERDEARGLATLVTTYREACDALATAEAEAACRIGGSRRAWNLATSQLAVAQRTYHAALAALRETPAGEGER